MQFTLAHVDMDCSLTNPAVAAAFVLTVVFSGAWLARVLLSTRPPRQKGLYCGAVLLLSYVGFMGARGLALTVLTARHAGSNVQVGCTYSAPLSFAPVAAALCALACYAVASAVRRWRPVHPQ